MTLHNSFSYLIILLLIYVHNCNCEQRENDETSLADSAQTTQDFRNKDCKPTAATRVSSCHDGVLLSSKRSNALERIKLLREAMASRDIEAFLIPSEDEHQNEYVAPSDKRINFISGFSGSAGTVIVTQSDQILWTDSRYTIQAKQQLDCDWKLITLARSTESPEEWIFCNLLNGTFVAADSRLFGATQWQKIEKKLEEYGISLWDSGNLFDEVWENFSRPSQINDPIYVHDIKYAGKTWQDKIARLRNELQDGDLFVATALDEVAWLLNLRGSDIPYSPVFRSYVVIEADLNQPIHLFIKNPENLTQEVMKHLKIDDCPPNAECIQ